jgi:hypothetical protein
MNISNCASVCVSHICFDIIAKVFRQCVASKNDSNPISGKHLLLYGCCSVLTGGRPFQCHKYASLAMDFGKYFCCKSVQYLGDWYCMLILHVNWWLKSSCLDRHDTGVLHVPWRIHNDWQRCFG